MSAQDQQLVLAQGIPAPQYFNPEANRYDVQTGRDGAAWYHQRGTVTIDVINDNKNVTKSYSDKCFGFSITNDGEGDITVKINNLTIVVKEFETFSSLFKPFTTVQITSLNTPYRAVVLE